MMEGTAYAVWRETGAGMGVDGTGRAEVGLGPLCPRWASREWGITVQKVWDEEGEVVQDTSATADHGLQGFWIPSQPGPGSRQVGNNLTVLEMIEPQNLFQRTVGNPQGRTKSSLRRVRMSESFTGLRAGRRGCSGRCTQAGQ